MKQFEFLDLVNPKVFSTWNGVAPILYKDIIKLKEDATVLHDQVVEKFVEKPRRLPFLYK